jgi:hypothetical protein
MLIASRVFMGEGISLEKRAAQARRDYWQGQYEAALSADDKDAAANALRFVQEYDALLALIDCKPQ